VEGNVLAKILTPFSAGSFCKFLRKVQHWFSILDSLTVYSMQSVHYS